MTGTDDYHTSSGSDCVQRGTCQVQAFMNCHHSLKVGCIPAASLNTLFHFLQHLATEVKVKFLVFALPCFVPENQTNFPSLVFLKSVIWEFLKV